MKIAINSVRAADHDGHWVTPCALPCNKAVIVRDSQIVLTYWGMPPYDLCAGLNLVALFTKRLDRLILGKSYLDV